MTAWLDPLGEPYECTCDAALVQDGERIDLDGGPRGYGHCPACGLTWDVLPVTDEGGYCGAVLVQHAADEAS